jgi:serine/threonine protein phosphatase PrpC
MLGMEVAILSDKGGRSYNEDACGHWHSDRHLCCVLADGAGGHGGGDVASRLAVETLLNAFAERPTEHGDALSELVWDTNEALLGHRSSDKRLRDMHTTVVCLVIDFVDRAAHWSHVGDSRLYWFRDGRLRDRTLDHSLVQSLINAGVLTPDQAREHPRRSELQSALGTRPEDLQVLGPGVRHRRRAGTRAGRCRLTQRMARVTRAPGPRSDPQPRQPRQLQCRGGVAGRSSHRR